MGSKSYELAVGYHRRSWNSSFLRKKKITYISIMITWFYISSLQLYKSQSSPTVDFMISLPPPPASSPLPFLVEIGWRSKWRAKSPPLLVKPKKIIFQNRIYSNFSKSQYFRQFSPKKMYGVLSPLPFFSRNLQNGCLYSRILEQVLLNMI